MFLVKKSICKWIAQFESMLFKGHMCVCVCVYEMTVVLFCFALFSYLADPPHSEPAESLPNTSSVFCVAQSHTQPSQCGRAGFSRGWGARRTKSGLAAECVCVWLCVCVCVRCLFSCLENGTSPPHLQGDLG